MGIFHFARFIQEDTVYHIVNRISGGFHFLRPDAPTNQIVVGVLAMAQKRYPKVRLYAYAVLSNHYHFMAQGPAFQVSNFVGFFQQEVSRRVGKLRKWTGAKWADRYKATALPTRDSQLETLHYVLSQGVKEDLVAKCWQWPGAHFAKAIKRGRPEQGVWLDGTGYAKALDRQRRGGPMAVRAAFETRLKVHLALLPCVGAKNWADYRETLLRMMDQINFEHLMRRQREQTGVLGVKKILACSPERRCDIPPIPWLKRRKRMIIWAKSEHEDSRAYLTAFYTFQQSFSDAVMKIKQGLKAQFPPGAFLPFGAHAMASSA